MQACLLRSQVADGARFCADNSTDSDAKGPARLGNGTTDAVANTTAVKKLKARIVVLRFFVAPAMRCPPKL
jgi:hypothetical protein